MELLLTLAQINFMTSTVVTVYSLREFTEVTSTK